MVYPESNRNVSYRSQQSSTDRAPVFSGQPRHKVSSVYLQSIYRRLSIATIVIPLLGTLLAIGLLWIQPIGLSEIGLFSVMYALTVLGIEVGYHRLFAHRSFQSSTVVEATLAILGAMAAQGGVIFWVAHHRRHHQYTDQPGDPHSPNLNGDTAWDRLAGLWHAQMGWVMEGEITNSAVFAKDLIKDPVITRVNKLQHIWVLLGLIIPALINFLMHDASWMAALQGVLWGGLVRIFVGQQLVNATNSICHMYGARPFDSGDRSTNNGYLAIPSMGQSWHNNHHAFPSSAVAGLYWWQLDPSSWLIRTLEAIKLVWNVKVPSEQRLTTKRQ